MSNQSEQSIFQEINQKLISGDFSAKKELIQLMNHTQDLKIQSDCIDLFSGVCSNEDFNDPQNFSFLEAADEDIVHAFAATSVFTLSYGVVPYLLVLLDEWDDTTNDEAIRNSLDFILSYTDELDYYAPLEEIEEYSYRVISPADKTKYYYLNEEFHPSILAKRITEVAQRRLANQEEFRLFIQAKLLANISGNEFPISYFDKIDEEAMRKIFEYIKDLIPIDWETGSKYFYGYKLD